MMYGDEQFDIQIMNSLLEEFKETYYKFHKDTLRLYESIKHDTSQKKIFNQKYPYFKKSYCKIYKLFEYPEFNKFNSNNQFKQHLYERLGKKIRGLFKHGQCAKTEISCTKIISDMKKDNITIAITKNTLLANKQWTTRCIKLMKTHGLTDLKKQIIVISSKENTLDGNATHCKNLSDAWYEICSNNNNYKVIFVCANTQRVEDVCKLLSKYNEPTFNSVMRKNIVVQYDEAHNKMSGVPVCRGSIENMLTYDFVIEFVPITASHLPINDETNPLWLDENIRKNKLNYINNDLAKSRIKSNDANYSSISDACHIIIDEIYENDEEPVEGLIPEELFRKHYPKKEYDDLGYLNACPIWLCGDEELVIKTARKILDNPELQVERQIGDIVETSDLKIFKKDEPNYHLMITPCRTVITEMIMKYAVKKEYNPVVIGLFGGNINFKYRDYNTGKIISNKPGKGIEVTADKSKEFNENIYVWLRKNNLLNRPVIIFGNYQNVGESNTFVNSDYGYLRSVTLLPGCNLDAEQHYQFLLRSCFLLERFSVNKHSIEKYIISYEKGINDALFYEKLNDDIVQELIDNPDESEFAFEYNYGESSSSSAASTEPKRIMSVPVQFKIEDDDCEYVKVMKEVMKKDPHTRIQEDKNKFMNNLMLAITESSVIKHDKNTEYTIELDKFILKEFRCYRESYNADSYRFKGYYDRWIMGQHYDNGELEIGECGFYGCINKHRSTDGHVNNPNTFYILFAYSSQISSAV